MSKLFLGVGTAFPLAIDPGTQAIARAEYEESVRQSILIVLGTARGERVMRPDFGCGIHDLVFEGLSAATVGRIDREVHEALLRFEPRIDVTAVAVRPGAVNLLLIDIEYEVRATNTAFNLVYPFYLQQGADA
ncbi:MAG TPA: GPW/gp25 family protein [Steroidobacteraceae bacterium]|nr:GPW/gp25 family protein [Steroidobacteraceae bacterium]